MSTDFIRSRKGLFSIVVILALGGSVWGVARMSRSEKPTLPKELSAQALKAQADGDPAKLMNRVHDAMRNGNLTEQQRHELWQNVRQIHEAQMDKRIGEYFAAGTSQRQAILDRQLDEMQVRMREMEQRRAQWEQERQAQSANGQPAAGQNGTAGNGPNGNRPGSHGGPSHAQRKTHSESRDPDQTARRSAYFTALRQRADERGIQMPFFMGRR